MTRVRLGELFRLKHGYAFKSRYFDADGPYVVLTPGNFYEQGGLHQLELQHRAEYARPRNSLTVRAVRQGLYQAIDRQTSGSQGNRAP